jgi:hypothetical protein
MHRSFLFYLSTAVWLLSGVAATAQTTVIVVQPDKDNTLYESAAGNISNGSGTKLFAGSTAEASNFFRRALLSFDLTSLPAGAQVVSAELTLDMSRTIVGDENVAIHRLSKQWGEAGSVASGSEGTGTAADAGDATWTMAVFPSDPWVNPGGDFVATASDVQPIGGVGLYTWSSAAMVQDVQAWLDDPASNFGWILIGDESFKPTAKRFESRETISGTPPQLRIEISAATPGGSGIPTASSLGLLVLGVLLAGAAVRLLRS